LDTTGGSPVSHAWISRNGKGAAATIFTQLVTHSCEHRTQVGTILGANGIEPPDLDSRAHGILVHGDDWPGRMGTEPKAMD